MQALSELSPTAVSGHAASSSASFDTSRPRSASSRCSTAAAFGVSASNSPPRHRSPPASKRYSAKCHCSGMPSALYHAASG